MRPDAFVALSDEAPSWDGVAIKKTQAATKRSEAWLASCAEKSDGIPMFAAIQGGCDVNERRAAAESAAARGDEVAGYSIGSLSAGEAAGDARMALLKAAIAPLPPNKPRHVTGLGTPLEIIACVEAGVDLIDASFCHMCTQQGYALKFLTAPPQGGRSGLVDGEKKRKRGASGDDEDDEKTRKKDEDGAKGGGDDDDNMEERIVTGGDAFKINLWALSYRHDKRPVLPGCDCFTCVNHSRAYIHHLLQCHEMTASVLLDIHNIHHYCNFFGAMRGAIREGNFQAFATFHRETNR